MLTKWPTWPKWPTDHSFGVNKIQNDKSLSYDFFRMKKVFQQEWPYSQTDICPGYGKSQQRNQRILSRKQHIYQICIPRSSDLIDSKKFQNFVCM